MSEHNDLQTTDHQPNENHEQSARVDGWPALSGAVVDQSQSVAGVGGADSRNVAPNPFDFETAATPAQSQMSDASAPVVSDASWRMQRAVLPDYSGRPIRQHDLYAAATARDNIPHDAYDRPGVASHRFDAAHGVVATQTANTAVAKNDATAPQSSSGSNSDAVTRSQPSTDPWQVRSNAEPQGGVISSPPERNAADYISPRSSLRGQRSSLPRKHSNSTSSTISGGGNSRRSVVTHLGVVMPPRKDSVNIGEDENNTTPFQQEDEEDQQAGGPWRRRLRRLFPIIHPEKPFRVMWETLGLLVIVWVTMSLPYKLAFLARELTNGDPFFYVQMLVNIFFIVDLFLNFRTAYFDENDVLVVDPVAIRNRYLRTWFGVDLLGAIPFDYIVLIIEQQYYSVWEGTKIVRLFKLLRLFRLLKLHNLYRFLGRFEEKLSNNSIKIFKLASVLILWLHFDACLYFLIARWHELDTGVWAEDSWVSLNNLANASAAKQYFYSLWHVASHMLSVTYGPVNPTRMEEVAATFLSMLCGAALYAGIIGTTASIMQASDPSGSEFYRQWDELKVFMRHKGVPPQLRDRLRKYFNARWKGRKIFDEHRIVSSLPEPYVRSLLMHECQFLLRSVPVVEAGGEGFANALIPLLQPRLIMDGETIIQEREPPGNWWLISRGVVGLYRNNRKFAELEDGSTFGEISLLYGVKAPFSVVTETPCQLYMLDGDAFEDFFSNYPELASKMKRDVYKSCRRWGLSVVLREAASAAEHASEFVQRIEFSWEAAEAELQAEAAATGESIEPSDDIFEYWARHTDRAAYRRRYADMFVDDPDYDIVGKLKTGFGKAGEVLRRVPQELNLRQTSARGRSSSVASEDTNASATRGADVLLQHLRRFGGGVESAFREPGVTFERIGHQMRDGMRVVRNRLIGGVSTLGRRRGTSFEGRSSSDNNVRGDVSRSASFSTRRETTNYTDDDPFSDASRSVRAPPQLSRMINPPVHLELTATRGSGPLTPIRESHGGTDTPTSLDSDNPVIQAPQLASESGTSVRSSSSLVSSSINATASAALDARLRARERSRNNNPQQQQQQPLASQQYHMPPQQ